MRITKDLRRKIHKALMDFAFAEHDAAMAAEKVAMFNAVIDAVLPPDFIEKTKDLPADWFSRAYVVNAVLPTGEQVHIDVYDTRDHVDRDAGRIVPDFFGGWDRPRPVLVPPLADRVLEWMHNAERKKDARRTMAGRVQSVLDSCRSTEHVYEAFPESKDIIERCLDAPTPVATNALVPVGREVMAALESIRDRKPAGAFV